VYVPASLASRIAGLPEDLQHSIIDAWEFNYPFGTSYELILDDVEEVMEIIEKGDVSEKLQLKLLLHVARVQGKVLKNHIKRH
jgi:hypothetical protein